MPGSGRVVLVSNRLPTADPSSSEDERRELPVGGLVSALTAALAEQGGLWFGWSGRVTESADVAEPTVSAVGRIDLAALDLTRSDVSLFYNSFCNRTLWPLLHSFPSKMIIRHDAYRSYRRVNRKYAVTLLPMLRAGDLVWAHDHHLVPLGHELRRLGWTGKIGHFLHTPFPPVEIFSLLPWAGELLETLFAYDLGGVQTRRYQNNLLDSLSAHLPGGVIGEAFTQGERALRAKMYPIGINPEEIGDMAERAGETGAGSFLRRISPGHKIILGVDRLDYTKGIAQRLLTFEHLLEHYPALRGRVTLIQISAPSRTRVPEYVEERQRVDQLVGRISGRFAEAGWVPIHYLYRSYSQEDLVAFYREADVGLITPLRDGMNLVAKEFVAAQGEDPGVVVLSQFCGAADTMDQALRINPYDVEATARAIYRALHMSRRERVSRWKALLEGICSSTARDWSDSFLADLAGSRPGTSDRPTLESAYNS